MTETARKLLSPVRKIYSISPGSAGGAGEPDGRTDPAGTRDHQGPPPSEVAVEAGAGVASAAANGKISSRR